jgi:hypothetical protein
MHPSKNPGLQILDHIFSIKGLAEEVKSQEMNLNYSPTGASSVGHARKLDSTRIGISCSRIFCHIIIIFIKMKKDKDLNVRFKY